MISRRYSIKERKKRGNEFYIWLNEIQINKNKKEKIISIKICDLDRVIFKKKENQKYEIIK